ncbi:MAG: PH domain-containing protein [bacterium]|nr:PH domain-containing protein [bacterium]
MSYFTETLNLDSQEVVNGIYRSHPFHLFVRIVIPFVVLCLLFLFLFPLFRLGVLGVGIFFIIFVLDVGYIIHSLAAWYGTIFVLTSRRVLAIHRTGMFKKQAQEIVLENISELSYSTRGPLQMMFRFGDVKLTLYTASHSFVLRDIPRPHDVLNVISQQIVLAKKSVNTADHEDLMTSEENIKKGKVQTLNGKKPHA